MCTNGLAVITAETRINRVLERRGMGEVLMITATYVETKTMEQGDLKSTSLIAETVVINKVALMDANVMISQVNVMHGLTASKIAALDSVKGDKKLLHQNFFVAIISV